MLAVYNGNTYNYVQVRGKSFLMTYDTHKIDETFSSQRGYYLKDVTMSLNDIEEIYELHFWVIYKDKTEPEEEWLVDEGRPLHKVPDIERGEVGLTIMHDSRDTSWIQHDKNSASKVVSLDECVKSSVEKHTMFIKGNKVDSKIKTEVSHKDFIRSMVSCRRENN
jgi:hypothetical protein